MAVKQQRRCDDMLCALGVVFVALLSYDAFQEEKVKGRVRFASLIEEEEEGCRKTVTTHGGG